MYLVLGLQCSFAGVQVKLNYAIELKIEPSQENLLTFLNCIYCYKLRLSIVN